MTTAELSVHDPAWIAFVASRSDASFFHRPSWAQLIADCYGFQPHALVVRDTAGGIAAGVPLVEIRSRTRAARWVALPFTDHCSVLGSPSVEAMREIDSARRLAGAESLEVRGALPEAAASHVDHSATRHTLDLSAGPTTILQAMDRMHRGSLRKAERSCVRIEETRSSGLEAFYRLHLRTRRRLGVPIQPKVFFRLLKERVLDAGDGFVLTAQVNGAVAAAGVFFVHEGTIVFKYSASDERSWEARPNHALAWWAIRTASERGLALFDWGRTETANEGLRTYKRAFGSREEMLPYSWIGRAPRRRMAPSALQGPLSALIRHSPEWLCRAFGETLYRFAS